MLWSTRRKARALSFILASTCVAWISKKWNCGALRVASRCDGGLGLSFASYVWEVDGKTQWHTGAISSFQFSFHTKAPQWSRIVWLHKTWKVGFLHSEAQWYQWLYFFHCLDSLGVMQIVLVLFSRWADGFTCLPVGLFVKNDALLFKERQTEGRVKCLYAGVFKVKCASSDSQWDCFDSWHVIVLCVIAGR